MTEGETMEERDNWVIVSKSGWFGEMKQKNMEEEKYHTHIIIKFASSINIFGRIKYWYNN